MKFRLVGPGRAGSSFRLALEAAGWESVGVFSHGHNLQEAAATGADVLLLAVPDSAIAGVAESIAPGPAVVVHLSGATTLEPLAGHRHAGSIHPLVSLPNPVAGSASLTGGAFFATASSSPTAGSAVKAVVTALGGTSVPVPDHLRVRYHTAAAVAANHLVVLCGQVERLAAAAEVPAEAFWPLMSGVFANVVESGAAAALTGPVARQDWPTVAKHLAQMDTTERPDYLMMAKAAAALADVAWPGNLE